MSATESEPEQEATQVEPLRKLLPVQEVQVVAEPLQVRHKETAWSQAAQLKLLAKVAFGQAA